MLSSIALLLETSSRTLDGPNQTRENEDLALFPFKQVVIHHKPNAMIIIYAQQLSSIINATTCTWSSSVWILGSIWF